MKENPEEPVIMMKLRYLFDNPDLARMLLGNWEYDPESLDLFKYYRISANAIYPFKQKGEVYFLRFCPVEEKSRESILAELEFVAYLRGRNYNALQAVPSRTGEALVQKATPWGEHYASVFKRVPGKPIGETNLEDEVIFTMGASLGRLHTLSSEYAPRQPGRWSYADVLTWIESVSNSAPAAQVMAAEVELLRNYFSGLPRTPGTFGLVHYDFEPDNVFYDSDTRACSVIDFDDAMYHWYVTDIEQALDSLREACDDAGLEFRDKQARFLAGYKSRFPVDDAQLRAMPVFRRFVNLYGYARMVRSIAEEWENEPEWLVGLRAKLQRAMQDRAVSFGKPLPA